MSVKIQVVGTTYSVHFWRWCNYLKKAGFAPSVVSIRPREDISGDISYDGFPYRSQNDDEISFKKRPIHALECVVKNWFDIIFGGYAFVNLHQMSFYRALLSLLSPCKTVITCWGSDILVVYKNMTGLKKTIYDLALRKAAVITVDGDSVRQTITDRCSGIDAEKIKMVYWGINTDIFHRVSTDEKASIRASFCIPKDAVVLFSPRTLRPLYRIHEIVDWFATACAGHNVYLVLHSFPLPDEEYSCSVIKKAKDIPNVILHIENSSTEEMARLYQLADLCLHFPESDATPVSMLEGFACGAGVVCNSKIPAYQKLAEKFQINLTDLCCLDYRMLDKMRGNMSGSAVANYEAVAKEFSDGATVLALRAILV